jgi:hypothetical protein
VIWLPATRHDVILLARDMRGSDIYEIGTNAVEFGRWFEGWTARDELLDAFEQSQFWALWDGMYLVGLAGVAPIPNAPGIGAIWFLGTDHADSHWRGMTRACRRFIAMQKPHWTRMGNIVPDDMTKRIRWLEKLGFDIAPSQAQPMVQGYVTFWLHGPPGPKTVQRP